MNIGRVPLLCCLVMVMQGLETFGISYAAPLLAADFGIEPSRLGIVFAATVAASLLGAIVLAPLSDRIGRRVVLVVAILLTGLPSLLIPFTDSVPMLTALRVIVGLGFGASLPVAVALVSEHAPASHRALLITLTSTSLVVGMSLAGVGASLLIPLMGWKAMILAGGALSAIVAAVAWPLLPGASLGPAAPAAARIPASELLQPALLVRSLLLCLLMMMSFMVMNFAVYWLPTLLHNDGYSVEQTGLIGAMRQFATVPLGFLVGWCMDRAGISRVLAVFHGTAVALFLSIAAVPWPVTSLVLLLAGMSVLSSALSGSLALVSGAYEPAMRATALGWVQGIARVVGGTAGTYVGGLLVGAGWLQAHLAAAMGVAAATGLAALLAVRRWMPPR